MKFAFSTNAYLKFSLPEAFRRLAKIGYAGLEIMAEVPRAIYQKSIGDGKLQS